MSNILLIYFLSMLIFVNVKSSTSKALKKLGKKIRAIRKQQKISQNQLAFESNLSREAIYRLELGYINATYETLLSIAEALNVHIKDLVDTEKKP